MIGASSSSICSAAAARVRSADSYARRRHRSNNVATSNVAGLVFGTGHPFGVEKMKESLWEVDRTQGVGFRDPRDEQAETLFVLDEPQLGPLTRLLHQKLRDGGPARVEDLRRFALLETVYRPQHVLRALEPLMDQGAIEVEGGGRLRIASVVSSPPASNR